MWLNFLPTTFLPTTQLSYPPLMWLNFLPTLENSAMAATNFKTYFSPAKTYSFSYPNNWLQVKVANGSEIMFHDMVNIADHVSVISSPRASDASFSELGSADDMGYRIAKAYLNQTASGRSAELVSAMVQTKDDQNYYILNYEVSQPGRKPNHVIASVGLNHERVFILMVTIDQRRWSKLQTTATEIAHSFSVTNT
jgi:photosystem II oxygen-evolving enhancer protein 2